MRKLTKANERGSILLLFIITLPFLILIAIYYTRLSLTSFQVARFDQLLTNAQMAADAGADYAVEQLAIDNTWTSTAGEVTLHNGSDFKTTYEASVSGTNSSKTVTVTGRTYFPASSTTASRSVKVAIDLYPVTSGNYSILTGAGGLVMDNNSKVVGGSVFVNGTISMNHNSSIGLSFQPVDVQAADQVCPIPADANYPRLCTSADGAPQPIAITGQAHIYGQVKANNQTDGSNMSNTGLTSGSVTPGTLPTYDRAAQKAAVSNYMDGSAASCTGHSSVTWPANTKITGDVTLNQSCKVTIMGNVWITGSLSVNNSVQMIISNLLGTTRPVIMVDGSSGITFNNGASVSLNTSNTSAEFITFYCGASCSPDTTTLTGTGLATSRTITTISLNNNISAQNGIFYAYWSEVAMNNSGSIGAVIGQTVYMSNSAAITFGGSTGSGTTTWVVKGYRKL